MDRENNIFKAVNVLKSNNIDSAIDDLNCVVKDMNQRNKIVRTADKYRWDVVKEYQDDSIADDTDDSIKLRQVIFRAKKINNRTPYERITPTILDKIYGNFFRDIKMNVPLITIFFFFMISQLEIFFQLLSRK